MKEKIERGYAQWDDDQKEWIRPTAYPITDKHERCVALPEATLDALLARDTEREVIFAEAMTLLNECVERIGDDAAAIEVQAKSIAARWQAASGDATGESIAKETI